MTDVEIYNLAGEVISSIANDIQNSTYSNLNGTLSIVWNTEPKVNAWAESLGNTDQPPKHKLGIHYELVLQVYRDIAIYCEYIEHNADKELFRTWFEGDYQPHELLTSYYSKEAYLKNMFIGAITWVFFHELGHLSQEHGFVRKHFTGTDTTLIQECNINDNEVIQGKAAAISHVTEIAADFEATHSTISELIRHFKGDDLEPAIYIFLCGISCVLYRFHGSKSYIIEESPVGSHPNALIRLESIVPIVYEYLSMPGLEEIINVKLTRESLIHSCTTAAGTAGLLWFRRNSEQGQGELPDNYFLMGSMNRPGMKSYLKVIVETWDEIEPTIKTIRRFGSKFSLLHYTQEFREILNQT